MHLRLATLIVTAAVAAAATSREVPQPRSAILELGAALASAELETIQWSSPLTRGLLSLMSALLSPLLRRAATLTSLYTGSIPWGRLLCRPTTRRT